MRAAVVIAIGVTIGVVAACREERPACYGDEFRGCSCADDKSGYQRCVPGEERYEPCVCDGTTPGLDGSVEASADAGEASTKVGFMGACTANEQCESGLCHDFAQKGSFCTRSCALVTDCPSPSTGCNNRGLCKAP